MAPNSKKYVLFIPDGAADLIRIDRRSPIALARTPHCDFIAREGVSGLMQSLYEDLPKESIVAQLGMLGWAPHVFYPSGRASCELLALDDVALDEGDLAFRANLSLMEGRTLVSYNANYISSEDARPLIEKLKAELRGEFPDFELYHNAEFRNTLVVRGAGATPESIVCPMPHESHGCQFDVGQLVTAATEEGAPVARRLNSFLARAQEVLAGERSNVLFPWSASKPLRLTPFRENSGFGGPAAIVGCMDFLHGIAKAGGIDFFKVGNGRPDTDYGAKGAKVVQLLEEGYELVVCHVNATDEASHMGDLELKITCMEAIDDLTLRPVVEYFSRRPEELGGVMIVPDHYTNVAARWRGGKRVETHSAHPVPFALWNGRDRDDVTAYGEDEAARGRYGAQPVSHLDLLDLLGDGRPSGARSRRAMQFVASQ
ncbi:MAG TPA: hypothetical protein VF668_20820 [Pyrinomonadaceae bacterium]|jgi:2,3-bisphosphoglycerate-independent phosphoglycerate mutase